MRIRLIALASGLAALAATPCLALTISSAPPTRDVAQHLAPTGTKAPGLQESFVTSGRPQLGPNFTGSPQTSTTTSYSFGNVRTTVTSQPHDPRWSDRRETPAPLSLSPYLPRR